MSGRPFAGFVFRAALALGPAAFALLPGCGQEAWTPSPVGAMDERIANPAEVPVSLANDMDLAAGRAYLDSLPPDDGTLAASDGAPKTFYLFYADGSRGPVGTNCSTTPSKFTCDFGTSVEDCQKKVQVILDKWYANFNLIFTLTKPTSGQYYSEVITNDGAWCNRDPGTGGVAPFVCNDLGNGVCFAFQCRMNAHWCAAIIAQEQAHLVGLEHTSSKDDVMYPFICMTCQGFQDASNATDSGMCRSTQNSYQMMLAREGMWPGGDKPSPTGSTCMDANPPTVKITAPADGATVPADFTVSATGMDDCSLKQADISAGGQNATTNGAGPYSWNLMGMSGKVTITVTVTDSSGKTGKASVSVTAPGSGGGGGGSGGSGNGGGGGNGGNGGGSGSGGSGSGGSPAKPSVSGGCALGAGGDASTWTAAAGLLALALVGRRRRQRPGSAC